MGDLNVCRWPGNVVRVGHQDRRIVKCFQICWKTSTSMSLKGIEAGRQREACQCFVDMGKCNETALFRLWYLSRVGQKILWSRRMYPDWRCGCRWDKASCQGRMAFPSAFDSGNSCSVRCCCQSVRSNTYFEKSLVGIQTIIDRVINVRISWHGRSRPLAGFAHRMLYSKRISQPWEAGRCTDEQRSSNRQ